MTPHIGSKVRVSFEMTVTSISDHPDFGNRAFICGDVDLGEHEKRPGARRLAYVSGVPIVAIVESAK